MKHLINRLVCLLRGHEWEHKTWIGKFSGATYIDEDLTCTRCGKVKEEWI